MKNKCTAGFARSGKDTFAGFLADKLNMDTYALAQPIKDIMCALFGWSEEHRDGSYKEIEMLYSISPETLDQAGILYNQYGLDTYEAFHDCWDKLVILFGIEIKEDDLGYCVISPRRAFQLFGTEWGRALHDDIWLEIAPKENTIITDVRFDNEAKYFSALGAEIIHIERPGFRPVTNGHASEAGVSYELVDFFIVNDKGLKELQEAANEIAKSVK
ncbi:putative hydrolase [Vibrio phage Cody]|uniref:Putative hydrolase n=2 Tax=Thalassavirus TaxID=2948922 RepID=A0A6M9Z3K3_9CAUD|nr:putative hydrolase [Vibrio phage Cody]YP_010108546.1 putative hydrolase [Vibrio phage Quinn]QKN85166.1 putative hydrolase [Vibrio phage Cody]QKN85360.1 putative hydrolase [Vibrio phage Quinn]QQO89953.1 putative hydrolase [Vibrio phage ABurr]